MKADASQRIAALLLVFVLFTGLLPAAGADYADASAPGAQALNVPERELPERTQSITIRTAEEFLACAAGFTMDEWTRTVIVSLEADISLSGTDYMPAPIFAGEFRGNGHTISGVNLTGAPGEAGIFGILTETAVVSDLNVTGTIAPAGEITAAGGIAGVNRGQILRCSFSGTIVTGDTTVDADDATGGIVGRNESTGVVQDCTASGEIRGLKSAGGIAGENDGWVLDCVSTTSVNTNVKDRRAKLKDLKVEQASDLLKYLRLSKLRASESIGGIAGKNTGSLLRCTNRGAVGMERNGYGIGGIAGETSGLIYDCRNEGAVSGKENVGGIAGQVSPYVAQTYSEDLLAGVKEEFNDVTDLINMILTDIDSCTDNLTGDITNTLNSLSGVLQSVNDLQYSVTSVVNTKLSEVRALTSTINQAAAVAGSVAGTVNDCKDDVLTALEDFKKFTSGISGDGEGGLDVTPEAVDAVKDAMACVSNMASQISDNLSSQLSSLQNLLNNNPVPNFSNIDPELNQRISSVISNLNSTIGCVDALMLQVKGTENLLNADLRLMTAHISESVNNAIDSVSNIDISLKSLLKNYSEVTESNELYYHGLVSGCTNTASVSGGKKVGGIAGTMGFNGIPGIEAGAVVDTGLNIRTIAYRSAVNACRNDGLVSSTDDEAASICGDASLGAITNCLAFGAVDSPDAEYVGGVAGQCSVTVRDCYVKCALRGKAYVGGIVGQGKKENIIGVGSKVTGCIAMVSAEAEQYVGAIAGSEGGTFSLNYFVSDRLAGINRYSLQDQAEPIAYESFNYLSAIPDEFKTVRVTFAADGKMVSTREVERGSSVVPAEYPTIPKKLFYSAAWNTSVLTDLTADALVSVDYQLSPVQVGIPLAVLALLLLLLFFRSFPHRRRNSRGSRDGQDTRNGKNGRGSSDRRNDPDRRNASDSRNDPDRRTSRHSRDNRDSLDGEEADE